MKICQHPKFKTSHIQCTAPLADGNLALMSQFPAFTKWEGRNLKVRINDVNSQYILNNWPDAQWDNDVDHIRQAAVDRQVGIEALVASLSGPLGEDDFLYTREPMEHQRRAFMVSKDIKSFAYLMEQGTGKTKVVIDNACYLFKAGKIDCLIIIAWPNGVHRMWVDDELPKDMSVPYEAQFWSSNMTKKKSFAIQKVLECRKRGLMPVMTFNVEAFSSESAKDCMEDFLSRYKCMVVIDQSASIKNPSSLRTKYLIAEVSEHKGAVYKRIMDGDPVAEGAEELYSQFKFLDENIIGHDTLTAFKAEYCNMHPKFRSVVGYKNLERLQERIKPYCFRVMADDCLDLPERVYKRWDFDLSKEELRVFNEMKTKSLAFFQKRDEDDEELSELPESGVIEETLAIVKNMRMQQISSGWWPEKENFQPLEPKSSPSRLLALTNLLLAAKGKALIFARFRADLELIQKTLGKKAVSYHGGVSEDARAEAKKRFMEDDSVLYFVGQPRNAGIGHTLTAAQHVIFYSNDHSLRLRAESEKRAHRKGLKHTLHVWDLCAARTQDKKILNCLKNKRSIASEILKDPQSFFLDHED